MCVHQRAPEPTKEIPTFPQSVPGLGLQEAGARLDQCFVDSAWGPAMSEIHEI